MIFVYRLMKYEVRSRKYEEPDFRTSYFLSLTSYFLLLEDSIYFYSKSTIYYQYK
jgi:hypothetical protein